VEFTVTTVGKGLDGLVRDTAKDLKKANRKAGTELSKKGLAAMRKGAPRMWGRRLAIKSEKHVTVHDCVVDFFPAPKNAGGWAIQESGRRGGYEIYPKHRGRNGRPAALLVADGMYAANALGGAWGGRKAWTKAGERLFKAVDKTVKDVYDDALDA
jgi:hypothetical protein